METFLVIDGNSLINRAFYGTQASFMKNAEGTNKTAAQTQRTSERQSQAMKKYWSNIPSKEKSTPYYI